MALVQYRSTRYMYVCVTVCDGKQTRRGDARSNEDSNHAHNELPKRATLSTQCVLARELAAAVAGACWVCVPQPLSKYGHQSCPIEGSCSDGARRG